MKHSTKKSAGGSRRRPDWLWLAGIAAALRFINLGRESIWYDEAYTIWVAKLDWKHFWTALLGDIHPPLWYIVEAVNQRLFGNSEFALRIPSAIFGVIAVLLLWQIARAIGFERRTAFVAGLIAAILPAALYYSQDARMYPLLCCAVMLAAYGAITNRWLLFLVGAVIAVYTHNLGAIYVAAISIVTLLSGLKAWKSLIKPVLAMAGVGAAWLPWLAGAMPQQMASLGKGWWLEPVTLGSALWPLMYTTLAFRLPDAIQLHAHIATFGLTGVGLLSSRKWLLRRAGLIVLAVVIGAPVLTVVVSLLWRSVMLPRAMLPSAMMMCLLWAYPLNHLGQGNRRVARAVVAPLLIVGLVGYYTAQEPHIREDMRAWLSPIHESWQDGDVIYYSALSTAVAYTYYLDGLPYAIRPYESNIANGEISEQTKAAMGLTPHQAPLDDVVQSGRYKRVWVISYITYMIRRDEQELLDQMQAQYHPRLIAARDNDLVHAHETIYLIEL